MKREFYSTSLVEAKGRGEIYKDDVKILEFDNDLTFIAKKDIINLICGTPLGTTGGIFPTKTKLQSLNQIGLVCLRLDKHHPAEQYNTVAQTLLAYTNSDAPDAGQMNAYTGENQSVTEDSNKQFVHEGLSDKGKLRKFGRCINADEDGNRDKGEGFGIGRPILAGSNPNTTKDNKTSKFASSITIGFNDVNFSFDTLMAGDNDEHLVWSDLYGSGGDSTTVLSDFIIAGSTANDGYNTTTGLIQTDLEAGKTLIQYRADWNVAGSAQPETQTAQQAGHLLDGERCILVGAYLMEHTPVADADYPGTTSVDGGDTATTNNVVGSTRVFNLDVTQSDSTLDQADSSERLEVYNDVYWTQNSMFAGKYLTEQSTSTDIVQITPDDTVKGTYTIDFTPSSGKFGNPSVESDVWSGLNCARLGTHTVPSIVAGSDNGGLPVVGIQGCCDWSVALAEKFFSISATVGWDDGTPVLTGTTKPRKLVDEFTAQEWFEAKDNQDGAGSTGSLMAGKITHVAVAEAGGLLASVVDVTQASLDPNEVTWYYDVDADTTGTYSNTCTVDFGNISAGAIKNRLFFYSDGEANASAGGNHTPVVGDKTAVDVNYIEGGMFPIHVSYLKSGSFGNDDETGNNIPTWNSGDKLIINFKIQWG